MTATAQSVTEALRFRYIKESVETANVSRDDLIAFLHQLDEGLLDPSGLSKTVTSANPEWAISDDDMAILQSVDDCMRMIFKLIDVAPEVERLLRLGTPEIAAQLLARPELPMDLPEYSILEVMDLIVSACVGWSSELGRAGNQLIDTVTKVLERVRQGNADFRKVDAHLKEFLEKEQKRIQKLEKRLIDAEVGIVRSRKSKIAAVQMINKAMRSKKLPGPVISFLQGPWLESVGWLGLTKGFDSEEWFRASKLTETLIWTFQPIDEDTDEATERAKQRLYRIVESINDELRELLVSLEHDTGKAEESLDDIEAQHVLVVSGQILDYRKFKPLELEESTTAGPSVSRVLLKKIKNLGTGNWFIYEDNGVSVRIKLVLKLEDMKQTLFTNRNGMKALEKSFDELAYLISSGVLKPLNHQDVYSSTFATYYRNLVEDFDRKQKQAVEDRLRAEEEAAEKEAARRKALAEAKALKEAQAEAERERKAKLREETLAKARAAAELEENQARIAEITEHVEKLNTGAWVRLPGPDGVMEDAKLAVKIAAADKMIFVNAAGLKIGEFTQEQLTQLAIAGTAEIKDDGVGFEDTLAQVVSKLRQDRNKSYDDLTGTESQD